MLAAAALMALAAPVPRSVEPTPPRASAQVLVRIVRAAEVRNGRTDEPHQRRLGTSPDGGSMTLIEFE